MRNFSIENPHNRTRVTHTANAQSGSRQTEGKGLTGYAAAKLFGEFGDEVVIDAILKRTEDDDRPGVRHFNLLN